MNNPLGLRLNNPLNVEHGQPWRGLAAVQPHPRFCAFESLHYGCRAAARILYNYGKRYGIKTIRKAIERWAPPTENNTKAYAEFVASRSGLPIDRKIDFTARETLAKIIPPMIRMEQGQNPMTDDEIKAAIKDAIP